MTIEEAKQMADQGDIGAMCSLGDFYIKQNTGEGIKKASKGYELAARKNVIYAIHMTVLSKKILAYSGLQVVAGYESEESVDFVKKNWEEVYDWASQEIEMLDDNVPGSEKIDIKQAVENYNDAIYYLALCNYELRNYDVVITLLKDIDDKRARILYGSALFDTANYDDEYEYAWQQFKFIDGDVEYASAPKAKYEEKIYTVAVLLLSQLYRQGLGEKHTKSNLEKSVNLLNFVKSYLTNEGMLELVDEELRHYQKKMLGGYKYV